MNPIFDADYSAIEARIVCWLAGQEDALEEYRQGVDRYKAMASLIYGVPVDEVNKYPQRFVGKQAILLCIAEGELVLTDHGLIPIEQVSCCHRVWDGVEWVSHEGVIYKGHKEVITYQGLTATPDHQVFIRDSLGLERTTNLRDAKQCKQRLFVSGNGRSPIWTLDATKQQSFQAWRISAGKSSMRLRLSNFQGPQNISPGKKQGVRQVREIGLEKEAFAKMACVSDASGQGQVHQPTQRSISLVWSKGNKIFISIGDRSSSLDRRQLRIEPQHGARSQEQRWALPTGEPKIHNAEGANNEPVCAQDGFVLSIPRVAVLRVHGKKIYGTWAEPRTDIREGTFISDREAQRVEKNSAKVVATYDILNAGPRNRFTVSNVLVHNCGFQGGPTKLRATCEKFGYKTLPIGLEQTAVASYRAKHKAIVRYWADVDKAAKTAIIRKGEIVKLRNIAFLHEDVGGMPFLLLRLPSGRKLSYPQPKVVPSKKFEGGTGIAFFGRLIGTQWGFTDTYGGKLVENVTQAVAADIMCQGAQNAEKAGYEIMALIHDQALAYVRPGQSSEEFVRLLTTMPAWADGLPLEAEGGLVPFYKKD